MLDIGWGKKVFKAAYAQWGLETRLPLVQFVIFVTNGFNSDINGSFYDRG